MKKTLIFFFAVPLSILPTIALADNAGDFSGAVAIGTSYAGVITAPSNGLAVQGKVGVGTSAPVALIDIGSAGTTLGTLRLAGNTSGYVQLQSAAAAGSWTMTLPSNAGTSGYVLQTNGAGTTSWTPAAAPGQSSGGRLQCSGATCATTGSTTINYCPYKGNIKTTAAQGNYTIPSSCLTATTTSMYVGGVPSTSLAANTLYYIYLWNNSGTWVLDAETTGHATDSSSGIEIMSDDNTKTLVGMIHTDGSKEVMTLGQTGAVAKDTNTVASWDNRLPMATKCGFSTPRSVSIVGPSEVNSENRCLFMNWGDSPASFGSDMGGSSSVANIAVVTNLYLDSVSTGPIVNTLKATPGNAGNLVPALGATVGWPSEGYHFTIFASQVATSTTTTYPNNHIVTVLSYQ